MELVATAKGTLMINRRAVQPKTTIPADAPSAYARSMLGPRSIAWCEANLKGFAWPRVTRLAEHERAKGAV